MRTNKLPLINLLIKRSQHLLKLRQHRLNRLSYPIFIEQNRVTLYFRNVKTQCVISDN